MHNLTIFLGFAFIYFINSSNALGINIFLSPADTSEHSKSTQAKVTDTVYTFMQVDFPPKPLRRFKLIYPNDAKENGIEGKATLQVLIGKDGVPIKYNVLKSSGFSDFDSSAAFAVMDMTYSAGRLNGEPVKVWLVQTLSFTLLDTQWPLIRPSLPFKDSLAFKASFEDIWFLALKFLASSRIPIASSNKATGVIQTESETAVGDVLSSMAIGSEGDFNYAIKTKYQYKFLIQPIDAARTAIKISVKIEGISTSATDWKSYPSNGSFENTFFIRFADFLDQEVEK